METGAKGVFCLIITVAAMRTSQFPAYLRFHEAGHATASWALGEYVHGIHLRTLADVREGRFIVDRKGRSQLHQGATESSHFVAPPSLIPFAVEARDEYIKEIASFLAGPLAEARQRRVASAVVTLGTDDYASAIELASSCPAEATLLMLEGTRLAQMLIRHFWAAIEALAARMQGHDYTDGEKVHELLDAGAGIRWPICLGRGWEVPRSEALHSAVRCR